MEFGCDNLWPQSVAKDRRLVCLRHRCRESGQQFAIHRLVGGKRTVLRRVLCGKLGSREQHRQLWPGQAMALTFAPQIFIIA